MFLGQKGPLKDPFVVERIKVNDRYWVMVHVIFLSCNSEL